MSTVARLCYVLIIGIAIFSNLPLVDGQFGGEDEASQLDFSSTILDNITHFKGSKSIVEISKTLAATYHPPLRYFLALPGMWLFPDTEFGLRFVSILISLFMTYQVIELGKDLGGQVVGFASGFLIAGSAVYNWTSMAFGWSVSVTMLILCIRLLRTTTFDLQDDTELRKFHKINLYLIVVFLINTGNILFVAMAGLFYLWKNRTRFRLLVLRYIPFGAFYTLYYGLFLVVVPRVCPKLFGFPSRFGQLHQNLVRAEQSHLNYDSFVSNLQGLNAYFFPFLGWGVLLCALYYLLTREKFILLWIIPFLAAWSFYFAPNSQQYFILVFICILPFGVQFIYSKLGARPLIFGSLLLGLLLGVWNYTMFIKEYEDTTYPHDYFELGYAKAERVHNIVQPYDTIGQDIDALLSEDGGFIHDISGCFTMFYYDDTRYMGQFGSENFPTEYDALNACYALPSDLDSKIKIIVTTKPLCPETFQEKKRYKNSEIMLFLVN